MTLSGHGSPTGDNGGLAAAGQTTPAATATTTTHRSPTPSGRPTTATPTATPSRTPTPTPTHGPLTLAEASNIVNGQGYAVTDQTGFLTGRTLNVLIGRDTGSAGTSREFAFFFVGTDMIGKDFIEPSAGIHVVSATQMVSVLRYDLYEPSDKVCCPTAGTADVTFRWDGKKLNTDPSTIPPSDPNVHRSRR